MYNIYYMIILYLLLKIVPLLFKDMYFHLKNVSLIKFLNIVIFNCEYKSGHTIPYILRPINTYKIFSFVDNIRFS